MEKLLSLTEVAEALGCSPDTLRYWRKVEQGPQSFKLGRRVVYAESDVQGWVDAQRAASGHAAVGGAA